MKLFLKISNLCNHNTSTLRTDRETDGQTDGQTTCHSNTALCVASRGKNDWYFFVHLEILGIWGISTEICGVEILIKYHEMGKPNNINKKTAESYRKPLIYNTDQQTDRQADRQTLYDSSARVKLISTKY